MYTKSEDGELTELMTLTKQEVREFYEEGLAEFSTPGGKAQAQEIFYEHFIKVGEGKYETLFDYCQKQFGGAAYRKEGLGKRFCACIKKVRKSLKARANSTKEQGAIAVCVKSVLQSKNRTLYKFKCGKKPYIRTQGVLNKTRKSKH
jgi:hypothetical protein